VSDRGVLSLLCFLTCTSVLSLRIGGDSDCGGSVL